jgi:hypothetical protein
VGAAVGRALSTHRALHPARGINADILAELKGPPPSKRGNYYDRVLGRFVRNPDVNITERAWNLYQQFGCWGRPFWVIQGDKGGHKRWFSSIEKKFLKLAGLPADPPVPGDLPYADFDERVMEQLRRHDRLQAVHGNLKRFKAENTELWEQRKDEAEKEFRRQLVTWLKEQVAEIAPDVTKSLFGLDAPRRRINASRFEEMTERAEENFIETGRTGTPRLITV